MVCLVQAHNPTSLPPSLPPSVSYNFNRSAGPIHVRFFHGGETNIAYNALDRHVAAGLGDRYVPRSPSLLRHVLGDFISLTLPPSLPTYLSSVAFYTERNDLEPRKETGAGGLKDKYTYKEALEEVSRIANVLKVPLSPSLPPSPPPRKFIL